MWGFRKIDKIEGVKCTKHSLGIGKRVKAKATAESETGPSSLPLSSISVRATRQTLIEEKDPSIA